MTRNPTVMQVVAAAITDQEGRWLLQKRPRGKRHAGMWEFPGGKVEPGETPLQALVREVNEELTITLVECGEEPVARAHAEAGGGEPAIVIALYRILDWNGSPRPDEDAELGWFLPAEVSRLALPPLDSALAAQLFAGAS